MKGKITIPTIPSGQVSHSAGREQAAHKEVENPPISVSHKEKSFLSEEYADFRSASDS